jgi:predicted transcriptional regulator
MAVKSENSKHDKVVEALLSTRTIKEDSERSKVPERTLYRIMSDEDFARLYREARWLSISMASSKLQQISGQAVDTLSEIMTDKEASASARVNASKTVIDLALRAYELEDMESRIARLERQAYERK